MVRRSKDSTIDVLPDLTWIATTQLTAMVVHDGKRLALLMNPNLPGALGEWTVAAVVMPANAKTAQGVLDDHSHKIVGVYPSLGVAFTAAEGFARAWLAGYKATQTKKCECPELKLEGAHGGGGASTHEAKR